MSRKKLLFFTPGGLGGAEKMAVTFARALSPEKYDVKIIVLGTFRKVYDIIPDNIPCECIPLHNIYCAAVPRIWWKIREERPDAVFTSHASYNPRVIAAARLAGVPVIARSSGMVGTYTKLYFTLVKATYKYADLVIAQQEAMREEMIRLLGTSPEKTVTLHNPLDTQSIDKAAQVPSPFEGYTGYKVVNIARVSPDKGQDFSIEAFAQVKKTIPEARLYLVGPYVEDDKYYQDLLRKKDELGLGDSVVFPGYDSNPYRWVKNCDCFILPSRREGLPNALIEAQYLGKPSVASRCLDIIKDIIQDGVNGYSVPVGDAKALGEAIVKCQGMGEIKMSYRPGTKEDIENIFKKILG